MITNSSFLLLFALVGKDLNYVQMILNQSMYHFLKSCECGLDLYKPNQITEKLNNKLSLDKQFWFEPLGLFVPSGGEFSLVLHYMQYNYSISNLCSPTLFLSWNW